MPNVRIIHGMAFVHRLREAPSVNPIPDGFEVIDVPYAYNTVLELDDDEAQRLIDLGAAEATDLEPGPGPPLTDLLEQPPPPAPEEEGEPIEEAAATTYDEYVGAHSVAEVLAYADEHPEEISDLFDAETAGQQRKTLLSGLEERMGTE